MAKKKKKKQVKTTFKYSAELYGVVFLLCSILGIGKYGPAGRLIASFGLFLVGSLYNVFLVVLFIVGGYLILKREWPDFFSTKLIGLYILVLGFLIMAHQSFVLQNDGNMILIFRETINQLVSGFNSIMNNGSLEDWFAVGGGTIGGCFAILFDKLFSYTGMQIVSIVLMISGICLFTGFSIIDFIKEKYETQKERIKNKPKKEKKPSVIINNSNEENEESDDKKIKITSINDLDKIDTTQAKDEKIKEPVKSEVVKTNKSYQLPPLTLLDKPKKKAKDTDSSMVEKNIEILEKVLKDFKIIGKVVEVHIGPTVAQYELEIASGTRVNKITSINREIALALAKKDVRIEAPIPGKNTVGIEFANDVATPVSFYEIISSKLMMSSPDKKLMVPLGKSIMGDIGVC